MRLGGILVIALLLGGCASAPSQPDAPPAPKGGALALGPPVTIDQCSLDLVSGGLVLQGSGALLVRKSEGAVLDQLQPQPGQVLSLRGALLVLDGSTLRELDGDGVVPLPGAGVLPPPLAVAIHPEGREIALWSRRSAGPVLVVEPKSGALLRMLADHPAAVTRVAFAGRGRVITADRAGWVRVWGATGSRPEAWIRPFGEGEVTALVAAGAVVAACRGSQVWVWALGGGDGAQGGGTAGPLGRIDLEGECSTLSLRDDVLAVAGSGGIDVWDVAAASPLGTVPEAAGVAVCVAGPAAMLSAGDDGRSAARWWPRSAWLPPSGRLRWSAASNDPVGRLSADTFVGLYRRVRCEQQGGDARALVQLLAAHGVPDLHSWTEGSRSRLDVEPLLLERVAESGQALCH